jgi:hypothetical protein
MERAVQIFAVIHLATMGVSHIARPRAWVVFFERLREAGDAGVFAVGFLSLFFGSIIVAFHSVWQGIPLVLTVLGWLQVAKGVVYFTVPSVGRKALATVNADRSPRFVVAGVLLLGFVALLVYHLVVTSR